MCFLETGRVETIELGQGLMSYIYLAASVTKEDIIWHMRERICGNRMLCNFRISAEGKRLTGAEIYKVIFYLIIDVTILHSDTHVAYIIIIIILLDLLAMFRHSEQ